MFGAEPKRGFASLPISREVIVNIATEEELKTEICNTQILQRGGRS